MQKRLSLADLKAKAEKAVLENAEIYMGGEEADCHVKHKGPKNGQTQQPPADGTRYGGSGKWQVTDLVL